jgi:hypothetical protein
MAPQPSPGMLKREAAEQLQRLEAKRVKPAPKPAHTPIKHKKPFHFLDLPAELRNLVYKMVAEDQTAVLKNRELRDTSGLLDIDDQIRNEYLPMLLTYAATIEAEVNNLDFQNIVTFLNRLSDAEVNTLPNATKPAVRPIEIKLKITEHAYKNRIELLRRWLNRVGHPTKKGTMLNISYTLSSYHRARRLGNHGGYIQYRRNDHLFYAWREAVDAYIKASTNSRGVEEAEKIRIALVSPI